jgi:hypothetical protein
MLSRLVGQIRVQVVRGLVARQPVGRGLGQCRRGITRRIWSRKCLVAGAAVEVVALPHRSQRRVFGRHGQLAISQLEISRREISRREIWPRVNCRRGSELLGSRLVARDVEVRKRCRVGIAVVNAVPSRAEMLSRTWTWTWIYRSSGQRIARWLEAAVVHPQVVALPRRSRRVRTTMTMDIRWTTVGLPTIHGMRERQNVGRFQLGGGSWITLLIAT